MSRYHSYLNSAQKILLLYKGEEPFASYVKKYFAVNKKYGGKDRKQIANLCYCYFRTAHALRDESTEYKILAGLFLCSAEPNEILGELKPDWNEKISLTFEDKCQMLDIQHSTFNLFPWKDELSEGVEYEKFCKSFLIQPDLFLRIRPHHARNVLLKLNESGISYEFISPFTIRLPNNFKAENYFELNREVVVQDYNSQKIMELLPVRPGRSGLPTGQAGRVWDCCAGSGGKSIMAYDINPGIELTVTDIRESILVNLKKRFTEAGIKKYKSFVADLTSSPARPGDPDGLQLIAGNYQIIIADVPCTGSGTWSRTPEQLHFFNPQKIIEYASLQKKIVSNVVHHLQPGGYFLYITCSVFKKENEMMVDFMKQELHLVPERKDLLKGYEMKADTMFVALLRKPL